MIAFEDLSKSNQPFEEEFKKAFEDLLQSGWYILGEKTKQFESHFAAYCGVSHCVGVGNGLDALLLALKACDFPAGSEVIVPSNTFVATILAILHCGLIPVLCEPNIDTYTLDPQQLPPLINARTKAIIPVHLYGKMCPMKEIMEIAERENLVVIEDGAQAHGATYFGKKSGSIGHFGAFSFYPVKNLGALGDGGAITTSNAEAEARLRKLRNYGSSEKYVYEMIGHNSRLDELQAAMLLIKLGHLDNILFHKKKLAAIYLEKLKKDIVMPLVEAGFGDSYHVFAVRHPQRDALRNYLLEKGVKTEIHYPIPPHQQKPLKELYAGQHFPISEEIHQTVLSLPLAYHHSEADIEYVCGVIDKF